MLFNEPKLLKSEGGEARVSSVEYVSVLFNEPKLLKSTTKGSSQHRRVSFSALQRAEIAEIERRTGICGAAERVSVLFNEPKLLKSTTQTFGNAPRAVSVLFNEPKLLKSIFVDLDDE